MGDDSTEPSIAVRGGWYRKHELPVLLASLWQSIDTVPDDGFFLVHQGGAVRAMLREEGEWKPTAVARTREGDDAPDVVVHETGVYEPTHWMPMPGEPVE